MMHAFLKIGANHLQTTIVRHNRIVGCIPSWPVTRVVLGSSYSTCIKTKHSSLDKNNILFSNDNIKIPDHLNLFQYLTKDFKLHGDKTALINGVTGKTTSYATLLRQSNLLAHFLASSGLKKGDVVGIHTPNCPEYMTAVLGTLGIGASLSPANPLYTAKELIYQMKQSQCKALITNSFFLNKAQQVANEVGLNMLIVVDSFKSSDKSIFGLDEIIGGKSDPGEFKVGPIHIHDHVAFLPYSSGTTGLPKGVMLTHYNIIAQLEQLDHLFGPYQADMNLGILPFFHIYGLVVVAALKCKNGKTTVILPKFDPESFLNAVQTYKVQKMSLVPPQLLFLLKHELVEKYDLSSLVHLTTGAAPCDALTVNALKQKFPDVDLVQQAYGCTETSPATHGQTAAQDDHVSGSIGPVMANTQSKICCLETGKALGPHQKGELAVKGPQVMKGYLNDPVSTARSLTADGWYHTGDIAYYDENHNFFIVDRLKELIKYKGFQVPPAELEALLISHAEISDAAVIGIPDADAGELPLAFVVKRKGSNLDERAVQLFVSENVASHKQLRGGVVFMDAIPKSLSGKLLRRVLKDDYLSGKLK